MYFYQRVNLFLLFGTPLSDLIVEEQTLQLQYFKILVKKFQNKKLISFCFWVLAWCAECAPNKTEAIKQCDTGIWTSNH